MIMAKSPIKAILRNISFILIAIFSSIILVSAKDRTILSDYYNSVFSYTLTNGNFLQFSSTNDRETINTSILNGTTDKTYSLFDRFGGILSYPAYYGESAFEVGTIDHIYSNAMDGDLNVGTFFYTSKAYLNTVEYKDRAPVALNSDITSGNNVDTRVSQYLYGASTEGTTAAIGNVCLFLSEGIVTVTAFFLSDRFVTILFNTINSLFSSKAYTDFFKPQVQVLLYIVVAIFIVTLVIRMIRWAKNGEIMLFLKRVGAGLLSLALIWSALSYPLQISGVFQKITTFADTLLAQTLNQTAADDDVIHSDSTENTTEASLWKVTVFEPWCRGLYGTDYEHLYTQFAKVDDQYKLAQSHTTDKSNATQDNPVYDSATMTGDVSVPLGKDKDVKNWGAYTLSTLSIYHIGTDLDKAWYANDTKVSWPISSLCTNSSEVYTDAFRWVDAKLNISPKYTGSGEKDKVNIYTNASVWKTSYVANGAYSLFLGLVLFTMWPIIVKKVFTIFSLAGSTFLIIWYSILELISERESHLSQLWSKIKHLIGTYFYAVIQLYILVFTFTNVAGNGFLGVTIYLIVWFVVFTTKIDKDDIKQKYYKLKNNL